MDWQRTLLLGGLVAVVILLFQEWSKFEELNQPVVDNATVESVIPSELPAVTDSAITAEDDEVPTVEPVLPKPVVTAAAKLIAVETDVLSLLIDTKGGDIVRVALPKYLTEVETGDPLILLNRTQSHTYIAQSGLVGANGTDKAGDRPVFSVDASSFSLSDGDDELLVDFYLQQDGVNITKRYRFRRGEYLVDMQYLVDNPTAGDWSANLYAQIKRDSAIPASDAGFGMQPFVGGAVTTEDERYKKLDFADLREKPFKESVLGGWVAVLQHYFISAWVPPAEQTNQYSLRKLSGKDQYAFGYVGPAVNIPAGQNGELNTRFYAGPKIQNDLEAIAPYLDLTVDYGWAWWISKPLAAILNWLHGLVLNWGWAIVLLTFCVRIPMYPLFAKSARSMAQMRKLQPEMQRLKDLYGDDRQRMSQEMMGLYKKHKVNPMSGCLPMLIPMPIFLGLYYMLFESVELRHADWFWIADLSIKDPLFVLPVIMGVTMWIQQKLSPQVGDPSMAAAMKFMPILFTFMFMWFPAGLVLYWTVNNVFTILQNLIVNRQVDREGINPGKGIAS